MKKQKIYGFYAFGYNYALLRKNYLLGFSKAQAVETLREFFDKLDELDVPVTKEVGTELRILLAEIELSDEVSISKDVSEKISIEISKLDPTLDAELSMKEALILTEKRFPLSSLTKDTHKLLGEDVFNNLTDSSQKDFSLACMQIALSQPTSSAFHLMRALEEEVKKLYFSFKRTNRLAKPMWAAMIKELRDKKAPKPSAKSLDHLDSIRVHFRNPTQHPDAFYSLDEAQDLLNQTITAINMISREISGK